MRYAYPTPLNAPSSCGVLIDYRCAHEISWLVNNLAKNEWWTFGKHTTWNRTQLSVCWWRYRASNLSFHRTDTAVVVFGVICNVKWHIFVPIDLSAEMLYTKLCRQNQSNWKWKHDFSFTGVLTDTLNPMKEHRSCGVCMINYVDMQETNGIVPWSTHHKTFAIWQIWLR